MAERSAFMEEINSGRTAVAQLERHHGVAVYSATVIAAADNHKWYGKGCENYEALHDAEAIDVMLIMFFKMKVQANFQ